MSKRERYTVWWGAAWAPTCVRHFYSFEAAEKYAKQCVRTLDDRGFSTPATIDKGFQEIASVRLDGKGLAWTDLIDYTAVYNILPT